MKTRITLFDFILFILSQEDKKEINMRNFSSSDKDPDLAVSYFKEHYRQFGLSTIPNRFGSGRDVVYCYNSGKVLAHFDPYISLITNKDWGFVGTYQELKDHLKDNIFIN